MSGVSDHIEVHPSPFRSELPLWRLVSYEGAVDFVAVNNGPTTRLASVGNGLRQQSELSKTLEVPFTNNLFLGRPGRRDVVVVTGPGSNLNNAVAREKWLGAII
jgi:hypothetical protein